MQRRVFLTMAIVALLGGTILRSEEAPSAFLNNFEQFVKQFEKESPNYTTKEQWQEAEKRYRGFVEGEEYKEARNRLKDDELSRFNELKTHYFKAQAKDSFKEFGTDVKRTYKKAEGAVKGLFTK